MAPSRRPAGRQWPCAMVVPGYSGGPVPDSHRVPSSAQAADIAHLKRLRPDLMQAFSDTAVKQGHYISEKTTLVKCFLARAVFFAALVPPGGNGKVFLDRREGCVILAGAAGYISPGQKTEGKRGVRPLAPLEKPIPSGILRPEAPQQKRYRLCRVYVLFFRQAGACGDGCCCAPSP